MRWIVAGASTIAAEYMIPAFRAQAGSQTGGEAGGDVRCVVSASVERGRDYAARHGIPHADTDLATALADPETDAVYISTTNEKHRDQALAAIAAGKHVLCEKPIAMTVADAAGMVLAARKAGVTFATNHHLRCSASHRAIRALVASGRIGRVLSMRIFHAVHLPPHLQGWRIDNPAAGGGVIPDITVHDADTVRFLLGEEPVSVVGAMSASGMGQGVEDSAMSVWQMASGAMVQSHESFTHPFAGSGLEIHGSEGSIFATGVMTQKPLGRVELVTARGREDIPFAATDLYTTGVAEFIAATKGAGRPAATGEDGVKSLAIALAVREAAASGQRQTIHYPDL
ncbi:Gfo/Idh/MocA family protein [Pseudogemmobacter bohemicus]|uniref:Gfo/Idh/MocA family protein n=1 Tax=Pseudogemmobacter bohemicus TaxID=2250708 RepID=UPI000DD3061C|nr:Gfo/Idh/MocA family oxidoreductase [Pseudogemmobacter bohemicus]